MALTRDMLLYVFPGAPDADTWVAAIQAAWDRFGFVTDNAKAGFLGIIGNESGGLQSVKRENMNYSAARAAQVWPGKDRAVMANRIAKGPEAFTNYIYANIIGNGDEASGDGWKFRGGGIIQLTGRANYRACGQALGLDLETNPHSLTDDPNVSAASAAWFMAEYVKIMGQLNSGAEADFRAGAAKVGHAVDSDRTRLAYRRKALEVFRMYADTKVTPDGNRTIRDIKDSTILRDSTKGQGVGTVAAAAGAAAPVITAASGMDWKLALVLGVVVLIAGAGALYYFSKVKKARRKMNQAGIA